MLDLRAKQHWDTVKVQIDRFSAFVVAVSESKIAIFGGMSTYKLYRKTVLIFDIFESTLRPILGKNEDQVSFCLTHIQWAG